MAAEKIAQVIITKNAIEQLLRCQQDITKFEKEEAVWTTSKHWNNFWAPKVDGSVIKTYILTYWRLNQKKLPKMAQLARKLLAIPATSTPSERIFSTCGVLLTDRRCRMNTSTLEMLIFLKYNMNI